MSLRAPDLLPLTGWDSHPDAYRPLAFARPLEAASDPALRLWRLRLDARCAVSPWRVLWLSDTDATFVIAEPRWEPLFSTWLQSFQGILAVAGIRGGAEYGEDWHKQATKTKRQVCYDDFIGAARWLKDEGIAGKLAIHGSSNGALWLRNLALLLN